MDTPESDLKAALLGSPSVDDVCRHADGSRRTGSLPPSDLDDGASRRSTAAGDADGATTPSLPPPRRATTGTRSGVAGSLAGYLTDGEPGVAKGRRTDHNGGGNQVTSKRKSESFAVHSPSLDADVFLTQSERQRSADSTASDDSLRSGEYPRDNTQTMSRRGYTTSTPEEKVELQHLREELNLLLKQYKRESELLPISVLRELQPSPLSIDFSAVCEPLDEKTYLLQAVAKARKKVEYVRRQSELSIKSESCSNTSNPSYMADAGDMLVQSHGIAAMKPRHTRLMPSFGNERDTLELELQRLKAENQELREQMDARSFMTPARKIPLDLSLGRDVTSSQETELLKVMAEDSPVSQTTREEKRRSVSRHSASSTSVQFDPSLSYQDISGITSKSIPETSSERSRGSSRSRADSSDPHSDQVGRSNRGSRAGSKSYEIDFGTEDPTRSKSGKEKPSALKKFPKETKPVRRERPRTPVTDSSSDSDRVSEARKDCATKRQQIRFQVASDHSSESDRGKRTPRKDSRKRRHGRPRGDDERDAGHTPTKRGYLKLDKYDGTTPLEVFLYQFDNCADYNRWNTSEMLAQLKGALKGNAAQILLGGHGTSISYRSLRDELQKCFGVEGHTVRYRSLLKARRRQPNENLQSLYQDLCHLLMLAYPGPSCELKDQLAVEAFVDSLDDPDFEQRIKDRFPENLADAFKIALRLEANSTSGRRDTAVRRDRTKPYRTDVDARVVTQEEINVGARLGAIEQELKYSRDQKERKEKEMEHTQVRELEDRMRELEAQSRKPRQIWNKSKDRGNHAATGSPSVSSYVNPTSLLNPDYARMAQSNTSVSNTTSLPSVNPGPTGQSVQPSPATTPLKPPCFICKLPGHYMSSCPQAICGNCRQLGHTRRMCTAGANAIPPRACFNCGQQGHFQQECPQLRTSSMVENLEDTNSQRFRANVAATREALHGPKESVTGTHVYLEMECMGAKRRFLLDSGCDLTLLPTKFVRGAYIGPTTKRVFAANATEIDLQGEVRVILKIGNLEIPTVALVSDNVEEGLIGYDWLAINDVFWGFGIGRVSIAGQIFPLLQKTSESRFCGRVVVQEAITIPPYCETIIPSKIVFDAPTIAMPRTQEPQLLRHLVVEPTVLGDGLYVAGAVMPNRCHNVPTRIVNTSCRNVRLYEDDSLGELQASEVIDTTLELKPTPTDDTWLNKLVDDVDPSVTDSETLRLRSLLESYSDCFSTQEFDLGRTSVVTHTIDTGSNRPVKQPLRRHPPAHLEEIDRQVKDMLEQDVIENSSSPWASNVVIVKKKDGTLRFCIDYRKLNDVTTKDSYPLPKISDCLDALSEGRYFSAFDLRSGYFQVMMDEKDKEKTSFVTRSGLYQFKVLPFGVTNGPATFQRLMDITMAGLNYQICLVYLDDIIVMSKDVDQHLDRLVMIFDRLRSSGLKLKPSKCKLLRKRLPFLGHIVTDSGIETDPEKIQAIADWPTPTSVTEVRSFVGLCSYYRRFVKDFAFICGPLHALTGKNARFSWTDACQTAFEELKKRLVSSPIVAMPQNEGEFRLDTDASNEAIGAVLSQVQDGEERVVAYASRLLTRQEKNYCVTRRELLAVIYFVKHFRPYLLGRKFLIRTDHAALKWLRNMPEPVGQQARWLELLEEYEFDIEHRPGKRHANADALSRRPCRQCSIEDEQPQLYTSNRVRGGKTPEDLESQEEFFDPKRLEADYATDSKLSTFHAIFTANAEKVPWDDVVGLDKITKNMWNQWERMCVVDGVLYRKWVSNDGLHERWQLVPPKSIQDQLMTMAHTGMTGGHMGIKRTQQQLQLRAYWPGWAEDVARFCRRCPECSMYHRGQLKRQGELQGFPVGEPFERIAIDLTGPHPTSRSGHVYILTVVDIFSKWAEAIPIRNKEAVTVARALMDVVIARFGVPLQLLSDNGKEFDNSIMKELCRLLEIDKLRTTVYKASTNGAVERLHRTMNSMLGKVIDTNQRNWDEFLPSVMAAYRASRHEATGYTPNFLVFGRENAAPLDVVFGIPDSDRPHYETYDDYAEHKIEVMRKAYSLAREQLEVSAERSKRYYDLKVRPGRYQVGQWVYYYCPRRYPQRSPKWQKMFTGPFLITKVMGPVNVQLRGSQRSNPFIVHIDKIKLCLGPTPPSWLVDTKQRESEPLSFFADIEPNDDRPQQTEADYSPGTPDFVAATEPNDERPHRTETDRLPETSNSVADVEQIAERPQQTEADRSSETTNVITETELIDDEPKLTIEERLQKIAAAGPNDINLPVSDHSNETGYKQTKLTSNNETPKEQRPRRTINRPRRFNDYVC